MSIFQSAALLLVAAQGPAPTQETVADAAPIGRPDGYSLVWSDEFDRGDMPSRSRWAYDTQFNARGWHNNEKQYYSDARRENSRVENGNLVIEARAERLSPRRFPDWGGQDYTSARLVTRGQASWTYGYFEIRAKLPCGRGIWPAIWTLADRPNMQWPADGEIDIMEHVGHDEGVIHQTIHTGAYNHVLRTHRAGQIRLSDVCTAFHTYQLDWTRERLRMGVDGRTVFTFNRSENPQEWPFDGPQYLILNVAVGGDWGGAQGIDSAAFPARMEVDYVRVYQAAPPRNAGERG